ncbi:MAG: magnesium chelatase subunit D [Sphingomonadaceae bacterium]
MTDTAASQWDDAVLIAQLFAADPAGFGGIVVRAGAGPVRDIWLAHLRSCLPPGMTVRKMPIGIADDRLLGGLDLTATLASGHPVARRGLIADCDGGVIIVPMAERLAETGSHLSAALDTGMIVAERDGMTLTSPARIGLILLDEGASDDETPPNALLERCAFRIDLTAIGLREAEDGIDARWPRADDHEIGAHDDTIATLCAAAASFGIGTLRAPLLALRAAKRLAAQAGRRTVAEDDIITAARLVLAPRATMLPAAPDQGEPAAPPPPEHADPDAAESDQQKEIGELQDVVLEAVRAALPHALLAQLEVGQTRSRNARGSGSGALRTSLKRGRPAGVRRGDPGGQARLHLVETLRAAAPWQRIRQAQTPRPGIIVRRDDFRIRRFAERAESTMIFGVDASGSAAFERLAETKGAVELLLAEAYVRRTQVALVAFRGGEAALMLPPTRSLARAKKCLAGLAGGGGTPLSSGIETLQMIGEGARSKGRTPIVIMMTDGRANIGRDGSPGRAQAMEDAMLAAKHFRASGIKSAIIDISARSRGDAERLAIAMGAHYAALPRVDAGLMQRLARSLDPSAR